MAFFYRQIQKISSQGILDITIFKVALWPDFLICTGGDQFLVTVMACDACVTTVTQQFL